MATKKKKKSKSLVCVICKGDKEIQGKKKCCHPAMTSKNKGSWNL